MKIYDLFKDIIGEDLKHEFKASLNKEDPIKWAKSIVAFANGDGGTIFVGVSDNGDAFGLTLQEIDKAKNLISLVNNRNIIPHVKYNFSVRSCDASAERYVLCVNVLPSDSIVSYKSGDFSETVFVKGDGNSVPATPSDIISLSKRKHGIDDYLTDEPYEPNEWSEYLDLCAKFRNDASKPSLKELQNENIVSANGLVKSGFLMFKNGYESDESLTCLRLWKGKDKTGFVLDSKRFRGPLGTCLLNSLSFIERNTKAGWEKTSDGGRKEIRSYPFAAIREALVNAYAHRDYSIEGTQIDIDIFEDRIDITSPGSWLLPKKYSEYPMGTIPSIRRNQIISAIFSVANLMERGGTGFETIAYAYINASKDKQPIVMNYPGFMIVRLYDLLYEDEELKVVEKPKVKEDSLDEESKVLELLSQGQATINELQQVSIYKSRYYFIKKVITPLVDSGKIEKIGKDHSPNAYYRLKK